MSIKHRLKRLEQGAQKPVKESGWYQRYLWMQRHYFPVIENYHREQEGLEPLPVPEEEEVDPELADAIDSYLKRLEEDTKR
jgi:hypothetical protein